jgi:hypothetical protein
MKGFMRTKCGCADRRLSATFTLNPGTLILALTMLMATPALAQNQTTTDLGTDYYFVKSMTAEDATVTTDHLSSTILRPSPYVRIWSRAPEILPGLPSRGLNSPSEFDDFLVQNGLAELTSPSAPDALKQEEAAARQSGLGMWARPGSQTNTVPESSKPPDNDNSTTNQSWQWLFDTIGWFYHFWKEIVALGLFSGGLGWVGRILYRRLFIQRKVNMTVIGLRSAGKSAVLRRFGDPDVSEAAIASMSPSLTSETAAWRNPKPLGRYEVHANYKDNPGESWGEFFNALASSGFGTNIVVLVISPTDNKNADKDNWMNPSFVSEQLGLAKALIGGYLDVRYASGPALIIIFLNKFDLVSDRAPDDPLAFPQVTAFTSVFDPFLKLDVIKRHQRSSPRPIVRVIIGSALKGWGTKGIMSSIEDLLYVRNNR